MHDILEAAKQLSATHDEVVGLRNYIGAALKAIRNRKGGLAHACVLEALANIDAIKSALEDTKGALEALRRTHP